MGRYNDLTVIGTVRYGTVCSVHWGVTVVRYLNAAIKSTVHRSNVSRAVSNGSGGNLTEREQIRHRDKPMVR